MNRQLTDIEYVDKGGGVCPYCGDEDIEGGSADFDGKHVYQKVLCHACEKAWDDCYVLTGYEPGD